VKALGALLKKHFLAGIFILIPLGVIAWILGTVLHALWGLHHFFPEELQPENLIQARGLANLVNFLFTIAIALVLALLVSALGWASKLYLGRKTLEILSSLIQRIPVIRSIYSALDQLLKTIAVGGGAQFSRVVYVEYPRRDCWALAFVTGPARGPGAPPGHLNCYVPTTPNPTSGFHLIIPEKDVRESHLAVEEAFKTILSLGIAQSDGGGHGG
jgi:uncharacterized membrane protein